MNPIDPRITATALKSLRSAAAVALLLAAGLSHAQMAPALKPDTPACGPVAIPGHYGPYDYITEQHKLTVVERAHFTAQVEQLRAGVTGPIGGDLSYTLNASPNHHRALNAAMRLAQRDGTDAPRHLQLPVSCYFDRAVRFRPRDTVVRALYALYLFQFLKRPHDAIGQVDAVVMFAEDNPMTHYNAGLLYLEFGEAAKAAQQARRARELGDPRTELSDKVTAAAPR